MPSADLVSPFKSGQHVRIKSHVNIGDVARISRQRGTTEDCAWSPPYEPVYEVWIYGYARTWTYVHHELEAVEIIPPSNGREAHDA